MIYGVINSVKYIHRHLSLMQCHFVCIHLSTHCPRWVACISFFHFFFTEFWLCKGDYKWKKTSIPCWFQILCKLHCSVYVTMELAKVENCHKLTNNITIDVPFCQRDAVFKFETFSVAYLAYAPFMRVKCYYAVWSEYWFFPFKSKPNTNSDT